MRSTPYYKDVIFYFYTDNCGYCKKMENSTFSDRNVINKLKDEYITVKVDLNKENEIIVKGKSYKIDDIFKEKGIKGIPAVVIYGYKLKTKESKFYYHFIGYRDSFEFLNELKEAKKIKKGL
ncbi:thioredoxin fold domain-containing protein [Candidatus Dependentiae bacterium]|nr:thioredoxin fold domain-containing protein [Candidatus Dependentiae bacterium]